MSNTTRCWLIERNEGGINWYISAAPTIKAVKTIGYFHWVAKPWDALRFSRKEDASAAWYAIQHRVGIGGHGTTEVAFNEHAFEE